MNTIGTRNMDLDLGLDLDPVKPGTMNLDLYLDPAQPVQALTYLAHAGLKP